ncbi:dihydroxyacetone kinase subunit DhaK, partial [Escherichia coli]|uniref:dihydroxyacetone kinase subunit DhaK n=1 Tax=Escherichia coli TaxID=562 RepID=UPI002863EB86
GKVGLISGGGSGHEPAHAGFVGRGMLDCAVAGDIFTSPTPDQVLEAIKKANSGKGVFMVIKNYQGDVMNFEMAKEMAEM